MYLVIAEKPSVARSIANVIGAYKEEDGYLSGHDCMVSWCLGHLTEYEDPDYYDEKYRTWSFDDLPIIPDPWRLTVTPDKKSQFNVLKNLMTGKYYRVEYIVNACDAGREGELIFRRVYEMAKCQLPVKRLWISSMEDSAILDGFNNLRDSTEYDDLASASVCRAKSDWLLGINDTRALTTTYGRKLIVGRVKTPTLAIITDRESAIENFKKEQYYVVHLKKEDGLDAVSDRYLSQSQADRVAASCSGGDALVTNMQIDQKQTHPPLLYDLTTLQRDANKLYGMTASKTLEVAQRLYENKLITYPRTDSKYLTEDMEDTVISVIDLIKANLPEIAAECVSVDVGRIMNSKKVSDHHAIIPTSEFGNVTLSELPEQDRKVLILVCVRLLTATGLPHKYTITSVMLRCNDIKFRAQSKQIETKGWKTFEEAMKKQYKPEDDSDHDDAEQSSCALNLKKGDMISRVSSEVSEHWTNPPKHFTEDSLLAAMEKAGAKEMYDDVERKGLGTPATRASTIEELIRQGYLIRKNKRLLPTDEGKLLISLVPSYLKSVSLTVDWENRLLEMEHGQADPDAFIDDVISQIIYLIEECRTVPEEVRSLYRVNTTDLDAVGSCPVCGSPVREGKNVFYCISDDCNFRLWKENRYLENMKKRITKNIAEGLLRDGRVYVKGLYSRKKDSTFDAYLIMEVQDGRPLFSLEFPQRENGRHSTGRNNRYRRSR